MYLQCMRVTIAVRLDMPNSQHSQHSSHSQKIDA